MVSPLTNITFSFVTPSGPTQLLTSVRVKVYYHPRLDRPPRVAEWAGMDVGRQKHTSRTTPVLGVLTS